MSATVVPIDDVVDEGKSQEETGNESSKVKDEIENTSEAKRRVRNSKMLREQRTKRVQSIYQDFNPRTTKRVFLQRLKSLAVQRDNSTYFVFNPSNPWRISWDGLIIVCLLYVFIVSKGDEFN